MNREKFYQDKRMLFFYFFFEVLSSYMFLLTKEFTPFFIIPVSIFGFMALLELWYLTQKEGELSKK